MSIVRAALGAAGGTIRGVTQTLSDRAGHDALYADSRESAAAPNDPAAYVAWYESRDIAPYGRGGSEKGYVRGLATRRLLAATTAGDRILDAGCGEGRLAVYLAARDRYVVAVDVSEVGIAHARELARRVGVAERIEFVVESLSALSLDDGAIQAVIGHASLHHFIKYPGVSQELARVLVPGGRAYFADSFGENPLYRVFHDRAQMRRLGDVVLTRKLIVQTFGPWFDVALEPCDWFTMLDKLARRVTPPACDPLLRRLSRVLFALDRRIPNHRVTLALSGSVQTTLTQRPD